MVSSIREQVETEIQQDTLADFLKAKRDSLSPIDFGLPMGSKARKTKGLTREEVSYLTGVSVDCIKLIEQGHERHPREQTLFKLDRGLKMTKTERNHMFYLANRGIPKDPKLYTEEVSPALVRLIKAVTIPAYVMGRRWDTLAWNGLASAVFGFNDAMPHLDRNIAYMMFLNPLLEAMIEDWEMHAMNVIGLLRFDWGRFNHDDEFVELINMLKSDSERFTSMWNLQIVVARSAVRKVVRHPKVGCLNLEQVVTEMQDTAGMRIYQYTPLDDETAEKLQRLSLGL
jgi:transcriptional regulator with XRE-family HTH domain